MLVFDEMMIYYFVEATFISNLLDLLDLFDCAKKLLKNNNVIIIQFTQQQQNNRLYLVFPYNTGLPLIVAYFRSNFIKINIFNLNFNISLL